MYHGAHWSVFYFMLDRFLAYFLVGMILWFVYKKAGNLLPAMLAHASLNYISIIVRTLNR
ncbi:type II CAAX prenyl endopeptidase Rce1 family protein [Paenibacillus sp. MZ04-78.2]|uniref:CPBP family glutamic-type intramembrane protease n=1 Tax=Paenibacillus sp. MZ04-78.2 TaxID=2962034 RepID=UPI0035C9C6E6